MNLNLKESHLLHTLNLFTSCVFCMESNWPSLLFVLNLFHIAKQLQIGLMGYHHARPITNQSFYRYAIVSVLL